MSLVRASRCSSDMEPSDKQRISSSPPFKLGTKRVTPTESKSRELIQSDNLQLIYEFSPSLNKPLEQIETQQAYSKLKATHCDHWGAIMSLLRHLVSTLMKLGVTYGVILPRKLVELALNYTLEIKPSTSVLLECMENMDDVVKEINSIG